MEQKTITRAQAVFSIIGVFFVAVIISGLIAQNMTSELYTSATRTIALLLWILASGMIWRKTK
jgi:hypothetical protein